MLIYVSNSLIIILSLLGFSWNLYKIETDSKIPVLEPIALRKSPRIVSNPITIPPNIAAVGIYLFNTEYTDYDR